MKLRPNIAARSHPDHDLAQHFSGEGAGPPELAGRTNAFAGSSVRCSGTRILINKYRYLRTNETSFSVAVQFKKMVVLGWRGVPFVGSARFGSQAPSSCDSSRASSKATAAWVSSASRCSTACRSGRPSAADIGDSVSLRSSLIATVWQHKHCPQAWQGCPVFGF